MKNVENGIEVQGRVKIFFFSLKFDIFSWLRVELLLSRNNNDYNIRVFFFKFSSHNWLIKHDWKILSFPIEWWLLFFVFFFLSFELLVNKRKRITKYA